MTQPLCLAIAFLAPGLFFAGAALVAVPILIHLLNRRRYRVVQWAAMEYLLRALKKNRRRLKFESLLLLLTRCALLLLLGAALARPFGCADNGLAALAGHKSGLHVFVIDNGYAMSYRADRPSAPTNLDQAKIIAKQIISRLSGGSEAVVVLTTSADQFDAAAAMPSPTYDLEAAIAMVDRIRQSYAATDMPTALDRARRVAEAIFPTKTLYILDDSTRHIWASNQSGSLAAIGKDLADQYRGGIIHYNLGKPNEYNPVVMDLTPFQRLTTLVADFAPSFTTNLRAYGQGGTCQLVWKIDGAQASDGASSPLHLDLTDHPQMLSRITFPSGGPHVLSASLISDDRLPCDDTRWRIVNVASDLKMLIVEGERQGQQGGAGLYLHAALDPNLSDQSATKRRLVSIDTVSDLELGTRPLADYRCIALCGVGQLNDAIAARLERFVSDGGALWIFVGPQTSAEIYNSTLLKHHLLPGPLVKRMVVPAAAAASGDGLKFDFDASRQLHPLLQPFYESQDSGLENARIFSYWQIDIPPGSSAQRVLDFQPFAGTTRKDPAFTLHTLGRGRVIFCSTTADANDDWTAFPAKKAFPEVVLCLFLGTVSADDAWMNLSVGDSVNLPPGIKVVAAPRLRDVSGEEYAMKQGLTADGAPTYQSAPLLKPGIYTLSTGADSYPIAVNVPTEEADTREVEGQSISRALGGIDMTFEQDVVPEQPAQADQGRDFGWSLMLLVLGLVGAESFMAMKFGRHRRT